MNNIKSEKIYSEAVKYIPGGVNSPVRAFKSVGLNPIFIDKAHGSKIYDVDGNEYIDYICSWGPLILGHSNEDVLKGVEDALRKGTSYGVPTQIEVEVAKLIVQAYPSVEMVRMVNSGTEATMSALRVARAYTKRSKILKFEGCYHGHSDSLLVKSGSGALTYGVPTSPGVPEDVVKDTLVCPYNDLKSVEDIFKKQGSDIAAVILEPVAANMGVVAPKKEFLEGLRRITKEYGSILIFDEVITGFRLAFGGAQEYYNIEPDMTCFGKIIGGGLPVGAYGGKREIMNMVSPIGPVYQAGTLSGNPLAMYMGHRMLTILKNNREIYNDLEIKAEKLEKGIMDNLSKLGIAGTVNRVGSLVCMFLGEGPVDNYDDVKRCDVENFNIYFKELLQRGILVAPTQFEAMFLSTAHTDDDIEYTIKSNYEALKIAFNK
ncbi:glutamate-1-semialdehyde 2,1-aminomutase [Alkalithermobacter paradoxus]|uniref:Glutamate-1-semialdehyde 2,1-aminomutase n=1 Tax=Alkalithermobacter paradoxus TaxID=29349 RepID=A0A1V4I7L8_9FIRM|nr:glutamate-1-semialdehyde 2,1-aminomutase [[Clostridium] thermoalcaliphilum]